MATPTGLDRRTYMYYSAGWQLLQEDIDDHANNEGTDGVNSRSQEVWGLRYIDDAMVRLLDKNLDGDSRDAGELFWQLSDAQFSSVAVVDKNAVLQERVSYTSYGAATHRWPHEVNNTGGVTSSGTTSDYGVIDGLASANGGAGTAIDNTIYNVAADLNRDGIIDSTDTSIFTSTFGGAKSALASGLISDSSGPDNPFGYDGYVYNPDQGMYTVRFRWYSASYGRWLQRDPAGYVDGKSLYAYALSSPTTFHDYNGHWAVRLVYESPHETPLDEYWKRWKQAHPGLTNAQYDWAYEQLKRGCIGITIINLGSAPGPRGHPDLTHCYKTIEKAQQTQQEMTCHGKCGIDAPKLFSVHFWDDGMPPGEDPNDGRVDMNDWARRSPGHKSRPPWPGHPEPGVNFDYGYYEDGRWWHANHCHNCPDPMIVYDSSLAGWQESYADFNSEVFCVSCASKGKSYGQ